jgi:hypothetical protein
LLIADFRLLNCHSERSRGISYNHTANVANKAYKQSENSESKEGQSATSRQLKRVRGFLRGISVTIRRDKDRV